MSLVSVYHRDDDLELAVTVASFHSSLVKVIFLAYCHIKSYCTWNWLWRNFFCSPIYNCYMGWKLTNIWGLSTGHKLYNNICV